MDRDDEVIERFEADAAYKWKANGEESSERAKSPPSAEAKPPLGPGWWIGCELSAGEWRSRRSAMSTVASWPSQPW